MNHVKISFIQEMLNKLEEAGVDLTEYILVLDGSGTAYAMREKDFKKIQDNEE